MKTLERLLWSPAWMSLVGCFKGCLDYLGRDLSRAWIAGGAGHAFADKQREAFDFVRGCLDRGIPCYGWELPIPEYYVICGYDDEGYYTSGPLRGPGDGVVPWDSVGDTGIGVLQINSLDLADPTCENVVVRDALTLALEMGDKPKRFVFGDNTMGLEACPPKPGGRERPQRRRARPCRSRGL